MQPTKDERGPAPWQILNERLVYERRPWLRLFEQDVKLPNGLIIEKYLISQTRDVAMVFATTEKGEAIFVEQYKHGIRALSLDLSAGYMDPEDSSPLCAAQRELEEETGFISDEWRPLASLAADPNRSDARIHYFLAVDCRPAGEQHLDPTEELRVHLIPLEEVEQLLSDGRAGTTSTVAGIALGLHALKARRREID